MFRKLQIDVNKMIELSREIGCLETEYKFISNIYDDYNYNKEKVDLIRKKLNESITELYKLKNKYND